MLYRTSKQFSAVKQNTENGQAGIAGKRKAQDLPLAHDSSKQSIAKRMKQNGAPIDDKLQENLPSVKITKPAVNGNHKPSNKQGVSPGLQNSSKDKDSAISVPSAKKLRKLEAKALKDSNLNAQEVHEAAERTISALGRLTDLSPLLCAV